MNRRSLNHSLSFFAATAALLLFASNGFAQAAAGNGTNNSAPTVVAKAAPSAPAKDDDNEEPTIEQIEDAAKPPSLESNVFESGQIVRRRLLYRSTRFELAPFFGLTVNDTFYRNVMPGVNMSYYLTNELGISASFAYGALQWETSVAKNMIAAMQKSTAGKKTLDSTDFMKIQLFADLGLSYVPIYGKFSLFGATVAWDFHLVGGVAIIKQQAFKACKSALNGECKTAKEQRVDSKDSLLAGIKPGGVLQLGLRFYLNDFLSLNFDVRNFIYGSVDATTGNTSNQITDRVFVSLGLGFFFPTDVKVSW